MFRRFSVFYSVIAAICLGLAVSSVTAWLSLSAAGLPALKVAASDVCARPAVGSAISLIGMWMQRIAVGWLTWQLTGSGFWLGIIAFADFFPVRPASGAT